MTLEFGGYVVDASEGEVKVRPDPARLKALSTIPHPQDKKVV